MPSLYPASEGRGTTSEGADPCLRRGRGTTSEGSDPCLRRGRGTTSEGSDPCLRRAGARHPKALRARIRAFGGADISEGFARADLWQAAVPSGAIRSARAAKADVSAPSVDKQGKAGEFSRLKPVLHQLTYVQCTSAIQRAFSQKLGISTDRARASACTTPAICTQIPAETISKSNTREVNLHSLGGTLIASYS